MNWLYIMVGKQNQIQRHSLVENPRKKLLREIRTHGHNCSLPNQQHLKWETIFFSCRFSFFPKPSLHITFRFCEDVENSECRNFEITDLINQIKLWITLEPYIVELKQDHVKGREFAILRKTEVDRYLQRKILTYFNIKRRYCCFFISHFVLLN